jgi:hypothetical protein
MSIPGITLIGAITMLTSDDDSSVSSDPVYIPAEIIEANIANGSWQAGHLNGISVMPPVEAWPPEWRALKEN